MKKVIYLAAGKLFRMLREPRLFIMMLVLPLGFAYVTGSIETSGTSRIPIVITDLDKSLYSRNLAAELQQGFSYDVSLTDRGAALKEIQDNRALAAFVIPQGFAGDIEAGRTPRVELYTVAESGEVFAARSAFQSALNKVVSGSAIAGLVVEELTRVKDVAGIEEDMRKRAYDSAAAKWYPEPPVSVVQKEMGAEAPADYNKAAHASIGFTLFFSMYTMIFGVGEILTEKKNGTWQRLLSMPLTRWQMLSGNLLGSFSAGYLQLLLLLLAGRLFFGVNWGGGDILPVLLIVAAFVFCVTCLGLLLSGLVKTDRQLNALTPVLLVSTSMLGGCFWPLDIVQSKLLLTAAKFVPQTWAISSLEGIIAKGQTFGGVLLPVGVMLLMGLLFFIAGLFTLRWEN